MKIDLRWSIKTQRFHLLRLLTEKIEASRRGSRERERLERLLYLASTDDGYVRWCALRERDEKLI